MGANGVGPKMALSVLSALPLGARCADRDVAAMKQVPGIGAKKAEKFP